MSRFRDRFPELRADLGYYEPGPLNAITDVPGVEVGQVTVRDPDSQVISGVTAVWPRKDVYHFRPRASGHILHGAGEMTGLHQVLEWGLIETPILLTSTLNVGRVYDAVIEYLTEKHPQMGLTEEVLIPVVAECDDSHLSRARGRPVREEHVRLALEEAASGPVAEGSVGAGSGMISFDFKAGIGTSSRKIPIGKGPQSNEFVLGALVNANVGIRRQLRLAGRLAGRLLPKADEQTRPSSSERSIIVILATDAPLRPDQLRRLSVRAGMGLARAGSFAGHSSGELILAFTTRLGEPRAGSTPPSPLYSCENLRDDQLGAFYEATVECVEESVLNALSANDQGVRGRDDHFAPPLPSSIS